MPVRADAVFPPPTRSLGSAGVSEDLGAQVWLESVTPIIGESTRRAIGAAETWLVTLAPDAGAEDAPLAEVPDRE